MAGTVVIKYGGSAMDDPAKVGEILAEIAGLARGGVPIVLVHGGGKEISAEMKKRGLKPVFVEGFRVTNEATMVAVEEVLDGKVNPAIVAQLNGQGGKARGMSGRKVFLARKAAAGLAEGIVTRLRDGARREAMARRAEAIAIEQFGWEAIGREQKRIWEELL